MKKFFLFSLSLIGLSLAIHTSASAQSDQVRFGIKAGPNIMKIGALQFAGTDYESDYKVGFQAGLYMDMPLGNGLFFSPEVLYSQKGGKVDATVLGNRGEVNSTLSYIDVPVLIGIRPSDSWSIFLGPQASFLVDHQSEFRVNGEDAAEVTNKDDLRKSIAGGVIGLGYQFTTGFNVNARYMMDFQSATKEGNEQDKLKNSGFALSIGYSF